MGEKHDSTCNRSQKRARTISNRPQKKTKVLHSAVILANSAPLMAKMALLFAGQGAQMVGMGKDLAEKHEVCRDLFAKANEILGYDLTKVCFEGPESELTKTENAQPAIYLVSYACLLALRSQLSTLDFAATAGLSLGEFTAL